MATFPRGLARAVCALALSAFSLPFAFQAARANPAASNVVRTFTQPNGTSFALRLWGDEFANGWETVGGRTVVLDESSGFWCYAELDATGMLTSSRQKVGIDPEPALIEDHLRPTLDVIGERRDELIGDQPNAPPAWALLNNVNVLVIMVQFPADAGDPNGAQAAVPATFTAAQMQANLFGAAATGPGNWTDYYDEISYGNLHVVGTVVGPFTVANDKNDYDDGPSSAAALVQEAIALADPSVDFSSFDNDGNGQVDMVAICYAGNGPDNGNYTGANTTTNNIWPHASSIGAVAVDGGARSVSQYFMAPELLRNGVRRTIGVYCHEFGHKIGLPDLYDTDGSSQGVGHWCLMGTGSWCSNTPGSENGESPSHMSAWSKYFMGWVNPTDQTDQQVGMDVPRAEDNAFAIRMLANPGGNDWPGSGEYFLIENRQQALFDRGLDGCGILVWHVDEAKANNKDEGHTAGTHRLLDLEEAHGGTQQLDIPEPLPNTNTGNRGDGGDPFPGTSNKRQWDGASDPSSDLYSGSDSNQRMRVLTTTACASTMRVSLNNLPPVANAGSDQEDVECTGPTGASVNLNGAASSDPDSDPLTYKWTATGITFSDPNSSTPTATFPEGTTIVTLEVSDGIETDTDQMSVEVVDTTPPTVTCPAAIQVECTETGGTPETDPAIVAFLAGATATDACDTSPTITNDAPSFFPHGTTTVVFTATDGSTNSDTCHTTVEVIDTTPPTISLSLSRDALWPPNHKMADITATLVVDDICDPNPTVVLTSITSDEPDDGLGDGDTPNDIGGAAFNTADFAFQLRSERSGTGDGRVYTIIYTASDESGNTASDTAWVTVPHSQKGVGTSSAGFALDGATVAPGSDRFTIVIPTNLDQNAARIDASKACLGNTQFVLAPSASWLADVNGDRLPDLVLEYSNAELAVKTGTSGEVESISDEPDPIGPRRIGDGPDPIMPVVEDPEPIGLHYVTVGQDFVIDDVFAMGAPVRYDLTRPVDSAPATLASEATQAPVISTMAPTPIATPPTVSSYDGRTLTLATPGNVRFDVFNIQGQRVRTVVDGSFGIGSRSLTWDGRDETGRRAPSGVYLYRVVGPGLHATRKITLMH